MQWLKKLKPFWEAWLAEIEQKAYGVELKDLQEYYG